MVSKWLKKLNESTGTKEKFYPITHSTAIYHGDESDTTVSEELNRIAERINEGCGGVSTALANNLTTTEEGYALDARQGKVLNEKVTNIEGNYAKKSIYDDTAVSMGRKADTTVGTTSFAYGFDVEASGDYSHAEGASTTASGGVSHAEGHTTIASADQAHAEGNSTTASGHQSHAEGYSTTASGLRSHAEGNLTVASGDYSHAEGASTTASGEISHAEGYNTIASGAASHAEGELTKSEGNYSHAEGNSTTASGNYSHAEGNNTTASGVASHAEGNSTNKATEYVNSSSTNDEIIAAWNTNKFSLAIVNSHTEGVNCLSLGTFGSHAEGSHTIASGAASHAEGELTKSEGNYSHAEGYKTTASGGYGSHAEGHRTTASGAAAHAEGEGTTVSSNYAHAEGFSTTASNTASHAEGKGTTASGENSHAEGQTTFAEGSCSHTEGYGTTASGDDSHAEGCITTASGNYAHAEGYVTTAEGGYSHAEGKGATASGENSHAEGCSTIALTNQHAQGHFNNTNTAPDNSIEGTSTGTAFVIGNGTESSRSNAFRITGGGVVYATNAAIQSGADYAEYFEWADGNPNEEDRVGHFVTFDEDNQEKIRIANEDDYILGIVSGMPSVIGNGDECWKQRYVLDDFGRYIEETFEYEVVVGLDDEGNEIRETKNGTKWKENPEYDQTQSYIPRAERAEWSAIGMIGVLSVHSDGTCQVNGYCKCTNGGIATACEKGVDAYRVIKVLDTNIIKIVLK